MAAGTGFLVIYRCCHRWLLCFSLQFLSSPRKYIEAITPYEHKSDIPGRREKKLVRARCTKRVRSPRHNFDLVRPTEHTTATQVPAANSPLGDFTQLCLTTRPTNQPKNPFSSTTSLHKSSLQIITGSKPAGLTSSLAVRQRTPAKHQSRETEESIIHAIRACIKILRVHSGTRGLAFARYGPVSHLIINIQQFKTKACSENKYLTGTSSLFRRIT